jgi:hypothetical protein
MKDSTRKPEAARVQRLAERLGEHPAVFDRVERVLEVVGNETGEAITADEAEELLVQELRRMGRDALQAWADEKEARLGREYGARAGLVRREKKGLAGRRASARSKS